MTANVNCLFVRKSDVQLDVWYSGCTPTSGGKCSISVAVWSEERPPSNLKVSGLTPSQGSECP